MIPMMRWMVALGCVIGFSGFLAAEVSPAQGRSIREFGVSAENEPEENAARLQAVACIDKYERPFNLTIEPDDLWAE